MIDRFEANNILEDDCRLDANELSEPIEIDNIVNDDEISENRQNIIY